LEAGTGSFQEIVVPLGKGANEGTRLDRGRNFSDLGKDRKKKEGGKEGGGWQDVRGEFHAGVARELA